MDFLDPVKKRAHITRLFIGYGLVLIAIGLVTYFLYNMTFYGYGVDRRTGAIIQNGLVYVSAQPAQATIYVNGVINTHTDARLVLPAGQYTIKLTRPGYTSWQRSFSLDGGSLEQLVYPVLYPQKLVTTDTQLYASAPAFATQSLDKRWLLVQQPTAFNSFDEFDLNNQTQPLTTTFTLPADLMTSSKDPQTLQLVEWASDNRHVLLKHTFGSASEFVLLDRLTPTSSVNLSKLLGANPPAKIELKDRHADQYFALDTTTHTLENFTLTAPVPTPLLTNVLDFKSYSTDTFLYASDNGTAPGKTAIKIHDSTGDYTLRTVAQSATYLLDLTRFEGHWLVGCSSGNEGLVYIYKDPQTLLAESKNQDLSPITFLKISNPTVLNFSPAGQFIVAQNGSQFAVYDAQADRRYYYELKDQLQPTQVSSWLDGYHLNVVDGNKALVFDFDGLNQQTLAPTLPNFLPFFDKDHTNMYTLAPSLTVPGRSALTSTPLKLP